MTRYWISLIVYMLIEAVGTLASVRWLRGDGRPWLVGAFVAYVGCSCVWLWGIAAVRVESFARVVAIYPIFALISGVGIGLVVSRKNLDARGWVGVVLGAVAIYLLAGRDEE